MKSIVTLFCFTLIALHSVAQVNLVPNPSFEDTSSCPTNFSQLYKSTNWNSFGNSPDFYHSCFSLQTSAFGPQLPNVGEGYAGFYNLDYNPIDSREFIGTELSDSLLIGHTYFVSFYLSCANGISASVSSNNQGVLFTTHPFDSINPPPINNFSHLVNNLLITDSTSWVIVKGTFIADSNYKFICLGNFYSVENTDTMQNQNGTINSNRYSYYFIDDICVSEDSVLCNFNVGVKQPNDDNLLVFFPNPNNGNFFLKNQFSNSKLEIDLYNMLGEQIPIKVNYSIDLIEINVTGKEGLFILVIKDNEKRILRKIFINKHL